MLRDVNINLSDGALASAVSAVGIHAKIGASPVTASEAIVIRSSMSARRIRELLGFSPLADAVMDSIENGANLIYCIPVVASAAGTPSSVTAVAQGSGEGGDAAAAEPPEEGPALGRQIVRLGHQRAVQAPAAGLLRSYKALFSQPGQDGQHRGGCHGMGVLQLCLQLGTGGGTVVGPESLHHCQLPVRQPADGPVRHENPPSRRFFRGDGLVETGPAAQQRRTGALSKDILQM